MERRSIWPIAAHPDGRCQGFAFCSGKETWLFLLTFGKIPTHPLAPPAPRVTSWLWAGPDASTPHRLWARRESSQSAKSQFSRVLARFLVRVFLLQLYPLQFASMCASWCDERGVVTLALAASSLYHFASHQQQEQVWVLQFSYYLIIASHMLLSLLLFHCLRHLWIVCWLHLCHWRSYSLLFYSIAVVCRKI